MQTESPALVWFSKAVVAATLGLIFLGGMVTSLGGGLSVPDWPTTFGYNLFAFPFSRWVGPVFWEHVHRLAASAVGLLTMALALWVWRRERRAWVRRLAAGAALLVVAQGVMGGLRVTEVSTALAILHGCVAQAFLCVVTLLALALSPGWRLPVRERPAIVRASAGWAWAFAGVIFVQLILGAVMRHLQAGLAIPTFPLTPEGTVFPTRHDAWVDIAMTHRLGAVVVAMVGAGAIGAMLRLVRGGVFPPRAGHYAVALGALLAIQLLLGASVIWLLRPPVITSMHVLNGAALLMSAFAWAVQVSLGAPEGRLPG